MKESKREATARTGPVLQAVGLTKTFHTRRGPVEAVKDVSLSMSDGEVVGFLGPNGAGKTTTIKMIAGLIRPDTGSVRIDGEDPHSDPRTLRHVGAVLEGNRNIYWRLTPLENLEYFGVLKGLTIREARRRGMEFLEQFGLADKARTPVRLFSRGMQQKVALAVALVHHPRVLLMDEPTLGLDVEAAETVKELIRNNVREGRAVLLTTHQLGVAEELSDRIAIIRKGSVVVHEGTEQLIDRFSGESYIIEVEGEIDDARRERLESLGAWLDGGKVGYLGETEGLYRVLDALSPLPLVRLLRDRANLTGIFLKLVREEDDDV